MGLAEKVRPEIGVSDGLLYGHAAQLWHQVLAILLKLIGLVTPLRSTEHQEALGMDVTQHREEAYVTGEGAILITAEAGVEAEAPVADPA